MLYVSYGSVKLVAEQGGGENIEVNLKGPALAKDGTVDLPKNNEFNGWKHIIYVKIYAFIMILNKYIKTQNVNSLVTMGV